MIRGKIRSGFNWYPTEHFVGDPKWYNVRQVNGQWVGDCIKTGKTVQLVVQSLEELLSTIEENK